MSEAPIYSGVSPLQGVKIIEIAGLGPVPFCGMLLSDFGASVIRIDRPGAARKGIGVDPQRSIMHRGRVPLELDLKDAGDLARFRTLLARADVLLEGMRPGAAERLGIGPQDCHRQNPGLIYARISGWGRSGSLALAAGHDINYIARSGLLALLGREGEPPPPPLTLGADFPAAMTLAFGIAAALHRRHASGQGAVVDQPLVASGALFASTFQSLLETGFWTPVRGGNLLDGGAPYYRCYETSDGKFVAVGALEEPFYEALLAGLGLQGKLPSRKDRAAWPHIADAFAAAFKSRTRDDWARHFDATDACVSPVLSPQEALEDARRRHIQILDQTPPGEIAIAPQPAVASICRPEERQATARPAALRDILGGSWALSEQDVNRLTGGPVE